MMVFFLLLLVLIIIIIVTYWYIVLPLVIIGLIWFFKGSKKPEHDPSTSDYRQNSQYDYSYSNSNTYTNYNQSSSNYSTSSKKNYSTSSKNNFKTLQNQEKQKRLEDRLQKFNLTEFEALTIFGSMWKSKFKKIDKLFFFDVIDVQINLDYDLSFRAKLGNLVIKIENIIKIVEQENPELTKNKRTWYKSPNNSNSYNQNHYHSNNTQQIDSVNIQWAYRVLELPENSSIYSIRAKYRELTLQYHPDRNHSPNATKKMSDINNAFDILTKFAGAV